MFYYILNAIHPGYFEFYSLTQWENLSQILQSNTKLKHVELVSFEKSYEIGL